MYRFRRLTFLTDSLTDALLDVTHPASVFLLGSSQRLPNRIRAALQIHYNNNDDDNKKL